MKRGERESQRERERERERELMKRGRERCVANQTVVEINSLKE